MRYNEIINEDLGNLAQLNVGSMINVLKQNLIHASKRMSASTGQDENKFNGYDAREINAESQVFDGGSVASIADLRKAYRNVEKQTGREVKAFALYINGTAVAFGVYDLHTLGGASRTGKVAFDFTAFKDVLMQNHEATRPNNSWSYHPEPEIDSKREKEPSIYDDNKRMRKYTGVAKSSGELYSIFKQADLISSLTGGAKITCKLVTGGAETQKKRGIRYSQKQIKDGTDDLKTRLQRYKNSKKPTAESINDFLKMILTHEGKIVRFAGRAYMMKGSSYDKIDPISLMKGATFQVRYQSAEPGEYGAVEISYKFDVENNTIVPYKATWTDMDATQHGKSQTAVLDGSVYVKAVLGVKNIQKPTVIPKLLTMMKDNQTSKVETAISALRQMGEDWPEFAIIEKSIAAEKAKKEAEKQKAAQ
jgi:hypothetical protein